MDAWARIFSLCTTRADWPTLNWLGTLVLQELVCSPAGAAVSVGVAGDSAAVGVGEAVAASASGVGLGSVDVAVGDGTGISGVLEAGIDSACVGTGDATSTGLGPAASAAVAGEAGRVAHPRRSIRTRIKSNAAVMANLKRS
jgi:hypothetical protein